MVRTAQAQLLQLWTSLTQSDGVHKKVNIVTNPV